MDKALIQHLEWRFSQPLPGISAQFRMAPPGRYSPPALPGEHQVACVLALLFPKNAQWHISFIHRTSHNPNDKHAGQVSFPGGRISDLDDSLLRCALRETHEEIGIEAGQICILGQLSSLYIPVSNYLVHPFVGYTSTNPTFQRQKEEVQEVLEVPLEKLFHPETKKESLISIRNAVIENVPYYQIDDFKLWGATAMIVSELEFMLADMI